MFPCDAAEPLYVRRKAAGAQIDDTVIKEVKLLPKGWTDLCLLVLWEDVARSGSYPASAVTLDGLTKVLAGLDPVGCLTSRSIDPDFPTTVGGRGSNKEEQRQAFFFKERSVGTLLKIMCP